MMNETPFEVEATSRSDRGRRVGRVGFLLLLIPLLQVASACQQARGGETSEAEAKLEARGVTVYQEQHCGTCHTLSRAGTGGVFGPSHDGVGRHAAERLQDPNYHGDATTVEQYIRESILKPQAFRVPGYEHTRFAMPAYVDLPAADLNALVHMLAADVGPDTPAKH